MCNIITNRTIIQVRQPGVSKLSSITRLIQKLASNKPIDYILCIANFLSFDEEVFVYLNGLKEDNDDNNASTDEYSANDSSNNDNTSLPRIGSANSLAKMYPSTDTDQIKYSSKSQIELTKTNLISTNCIIDTIKVGRFATRAKHYLNDSKKVEELLYKLSQTIDQDDVKNNNKIDSDIRNLSSIRNWSVNSDLSKLNEYDDILTSQSPINNNIIIDRGGGGADKLFGSLHDNDISISAAPSDIPPTALPPTSILDNEGSDYGSFDDEPQKIKKQQLEETKIQSKQRQTDTVDVD